MHQFTISQTSKTLVDLSICCSRRSIVDRSNFQSHAMVSYIIQCPTKVIPCWNTQELGEKTLVHSYWRRIVKLSSYLWKQTINDYWLGHLTRTRSWLGQPVNSSPLFFLDLFFHGWYGWPEIDWNRQMHAPAGRDLNGSAEGEPNVLLL